MEQQCLFLMLELKALLIQNLIQYFYRIYGLHRTDHVHFQKSTLTFQSALPEDPAFRSFFRNRVV